MSSQALLEVRRLEKHFPVRRGLLRREVGVLRAIDGVDLSIARGETVGLVGESGSGKTTFARCIVRLIEPTGGEIELCGEDLLGLRPRELRRRRRDFQMIFQDPFGSLNPRMRVGRMIEEPLAIHDVVPRRDRAAEVERLLGEVGLDGSATRRYPHEFSGGQRQRVGIARALASRPLLVVADEPVSALDVSVQGQIVNLLTELRASRKLALLFIAHDLAVVQQISHRVAVLYLGKLVELAETDLLFSRPLHPYTVALLSAVPVADPSSGRRRIVLAGEPPSPVEPPQGCAFHPRCPIAQEKCRVEQPELRRVEPERTVACHFPGELSESPQRPLQDGTF